MKQHSICSDFLSCLGVAHTVQYTDKRFADSPYSGTLKGLADLLDEYDVATELQNFPDKSKIDNLKVPFVAMMRGRLAIVTSIGKEKVGVMIDGKEEIIPVEDFIKRWNGHALFAHPDKDSAEPSLTMHRRIGAMNYIRRWGIAVCLSILFIALFTVNGLWHNVGCILVAIFDAIGIYVCYLLLRKQLHIKSNAADAMCGFLEKGGCGSIMDRKVSKIFGVIGWGEVGMAYFSVSLLALVCYPACIGYLALFNAFCLPYTVWSISYQKFVAKTWCTLCVTVQTLQWLLFGSYLLAHAWHGIWPLHLSSFLLGVGYLLVLLLIDRLLPVISDAYRLKSVENSYDNLRLQSEVFTQQQTQQPVVSSAESSEALLFGNPDNTPAVIIFSDPFSPQAASIRHEVDKLLKKGMTVGYVLLNNSAESETIDRKIIALYQTAGALSTWDILGKWFALPERTADFFDAYHLSDKTPDVDAVIDAQKKWQQESSLYAAPTIIVGNHLLSPLYTPTDLIYIY